jgi:hypothetical protein
VDLEYCGAAAVGLMVGSSVVEQSSMVERSRVVAGAPPQPWAVGGAEGGGCSI